MYFLLLNGDFSIAILVFMGVCQGANHGVSNSLYFFAEEIALTSQDFGHHITELPGVFPLLLFALCTLYSVSSTWMYIVVIVCNCSTANCERCLDKRASGSKAIPTENCWRKFGCACFKLKVGLVFKKPLDGFCWHNSCCQKKYLLIFFVI